MLSRLFANEVIDLVRSKAPLSIALLDDEGKDISDRVLLELTAPLDGTSSNANNLVFINTTDRTIRVSKLAIYGSDGTLLNTPQLARPESVNPGGALQATPKSLSLGV